MAISIKKARIKRKHKRIRAKISRTAQVPRLCVFRSANHIYCNLIDDEKNRVILSAKDFEIKKTKISDKVEKKSISAEIAADKENKTDGKSAQKPKIKEKRALGSKEVLAFEVGKLIAQKALENKIKKVVFDRGGFAYHGRVRFLAEGAREGGLEF
ncbi:MAG: 50S ribosomal protein L18 [Candidatus Nealsonbacteria bacterium]|nr:50S ribosomal protein L18 [Candidatus Nealsonbacteria bacterium]